MTTDFSIKCSGFLSKKPSKGKIDYVFLIHFECFSFYDAQCVIYKYIKDNSIISPCVKWMII